MIDVFTALNYNLFFFNVLMNENTNKLNNTRYTLLQRACDLEDEAAWEEFVEHYRKFIFYILHNMGVADYEVEDVAQQVLLSLTKNISRYDSSRSRFRTWLSVVIRNAALVNYRKHKSEEEHIQVFGEDYVISRMENSSEIEKRIEQEWEAYVVNIAMERIRKVFKGQAIKVFELGLDGLSAAEIAEQTGLSVASVYTLRKRVKKRLYRGVRALIEELEPPE
ncbi:sigma-70 family RNA polymerase sigma factor [Pontiellaceae bacterium B12219]|nr:sigma-70 family RNA polymerase sigma factor [Pontiellaceae bacterium B12219]